MAAGNYTLATTTATTTADIISSNRAPVVTNPGPQTTFQSITVALTIAAVDPDGNPLTWSAANLPPGVTINTSTGAITGTPTTLGAYAVVVTVSDGDADVQVPFTWSVAPLPTPGPTAPVSPIGPISVTTPTFSWSAIPIATYYLLSITDATAGPATQVWYTPAQAGCAGGVGPCAVAAPRTMQAGLVSWRVITWNPTGYGPWSSTANAVVNLADASVPSPTTVGPSGPIATRTPTYTWNSVASAIWYQLAVTDALGVVREFWHTPAQACAGSPCAVTPNVLLPIGPAQWRVRAWRTSGAGVWSGFVSFDAADSVPGAATLMQPNTAVSTQTPSFTWNGVIGTSYYLLRITDRDNVTFDRWYVPSAIGCPLGAGVCSAAPGIALKAGAASWKVLTWNGSGYGPWSSTRSFLIEVPDAAAPAPSAVSPLASIVTTPIQFRWSATSGALSYRLSIRNNGGAASDTWYSAAAAGCEASSECAAVTTISLANGTAEWRVQAWTSNGYSPWTPWVNVSVSIPAPPAPALVSPSGSGGGAAPTFRWNASTNATLYYLKASDATGLRVNVWLTPTQVGCASGGLCTFSAGVTMASGSASWQALAWNPTGYSAWAPVMAFVVP
jgi:hypothetical protein